MKRVELTKYPDSVPDPSPAFLRLSFFGCPIILEAAAIFQITPLLLVAEARQSGLFSTAAKNAKTNANAKIRSECPDSKRFLFLMTELCYITKQASVLCKGWFSLVHKVLLLLLLLPSLVKE